MTMENVNLQELQRLNEAITVTFDAIRRVAPQLQALQHMAQLQVPWQPFGLGTQPPFGVQTPYGMQHPLFQHLVPQMHPWMQYQQPFHFTQSYGQQYGQQPFSFGQQPFSFGQQPFSFGQQPFSFGQQPFSFQQPFGQQYGQRIF